jgi:cell wall assembly regulator SMI1
MVNRPWKSVMDRNRRNVLTGGSLIGALAAAGLLPAMCAKGPGEAKSGTADGRPPQRPAGKPKPLLEEDIRPVLARLDAWYAVHLSSDRYAFNPPATEAELDAFERLVGLEMPPAYRQLYRWHDGENDDRFGHVYGLPLLPLHQAASQWRAWIGVLADLGGNRYEIPGGSWPEGAVDPAYFNRRWIPLTHDGSGNHIGLDFDPWPRGRVGQVILFGRDEDVKAVLADSLGGFLGWLAGLLESGNFRLDADSRQIVLRQFRLKAPPEDHFHEGARILRGAPGPLLEP